MTDGKLSATLLIWSEKMMEFFTTILYVSGTTAGAVGVRV